MNSSKFDAVDSTKHGDLFKSKPLELHSDIHEMMDQALPIWEILKLTEESYYEKYVKPHLLKAAAVLENVVEAVEEVVKIVEEIEPATKQFGDVLLDVCNVIEYELKEFEAVVDVSDVMLVLTEPECENGDSDNDSDNDTIPTAISPLTEPSSLVGESIVEPEVEPVVELLNHMINLYTSC